MCPDRRQMACFLVVLVLVVVVGDFGRGLFVMLICFIVVYTHFLSSLADMEIVMVAQAGLELSTILPKPPECWDHRPKPTVGMEVNFP